MEDRCLHHPLKKACVSILCSKQTILSMVKPAASSRSIFLKTLSIFPIVYAWIHWDAIDRNDSVP
jgi:hypothetical protein